MNREGPKLILTPDNQASDTVTREEFLEMKRKGYIPEVFLTDRLREFDDMAS